MTSYKVSPQVLVAIAASGGAFIYGVSLGWSAVAGPTITTSDLYKNNDSFLYYLMTFIGGSFGCIASGLTKNRFGSKITILIFALPIVLGWLLPFISLSTLTFTVRRFLFGLAYGAYTFTIPVFIGEFSSMEIRGILITIYQVYFLLGAVYVKFLDEVVGFSMVNLICAVFVGVYSIIFMFLPESPIFFVRKRENEKAEKSLKVLRGPNYDAQSEVLYLQQIQEAAPKTSFLTEFKRRETLKAFLIILGLNFFLQMAGANGVFFYFSSFVDRAGISMNPTNITIIIEVFQVMTTVLTMPLVDRLGRKFVLKFSFGLMIATMICLGSFFTITINFNYNPPNWIPLLAALVFIVGFAGLASVQCVLAGELFSSNAKKFIAPLSQSLIFIFTFTVALFMPKSTVKTFFGSAILNTLGLLFTLKVIPETKKKSLAEIQNLLKN